MTSIKTNQRNSFTPGNSVGTLRKVCSSWRALFNAEKNAGGMHAGMGRVLLLIDPLNDDIKCVNLKWTINLSMTVGTPSKSSQVIDVHFLTQSNTRGVHVGKRRVLLLIRGKFAEHLYFLSFIFRGLCVKHKYSTLNNQCSRAASSNACFLLKACQI
jgi:hypothetical protein